jgi:type I restriction enzyme, S subunit
MSELKTFKLAEVCSKIGSGATPRGGKEAYFETEEYSLIRSQNVLDFSFSKDGLAFISEEQAKELRNVTIEKDDILLNITGDSVARVCQVPDEILPARVNQHVAIIRGNSSIINQKYLKYYLLEPSFKGYMLGMSSSGATRNALTKAMIENFEIKLPDLSIQTQIAQILTSLDDKIELNLQMNQTLEAMAQALFKEWFVNFNFPNFDGELENGLPKGWRMGSLKDISTNFDNKRVPLSSMLRKDRQGIYPYYGAATIFDYIDDYIFDGTYLLMGEDGTVQTEEGFPLLQYVWGKFWVNNHTHVLQGKTPFSTEYLYLLLSKTNITHLITGAVQPKINQGNMNKIECVLPTVKILNDFQKVIDPIFEKIKSNKIQIQTLTQTRDTLLPKLMSGKIEISN